MKSIKFVAMWSCIIIILLQLPASAVAAAKDMTTKYRVYQNNRPLMEFSDQQKAIDYARKYAYSYVEEIGSRKWVWSQFPKYQVFERSKPLNTYFTLQEAINAAQQLPYSSIRHIESGGWEWHNYPRYRLYQGEFTQPSWEFTSLEAAKQEANRWANSYIIDLDNNQWIWDRISAEQKAEYRKRDKVYKVYQFAFSKDEWEFAYIEDAIKEALRWKHSHIVNTVKDQVVFSNASHFIVYQHDTKLEQFVSLEAAIQYAKRWDHAKILFEDEEIWTNAPYYIVYQQEEKLKEFALLKDAVDFALKQPKATIKTALNKTVWDNSSGLKFWAWNGSATTATVKEVVGRTTGLDVNSPTWFELKDEHGNVTDKSSKELAQWLKEQGLEIHPLIHNQFDAALTSKFLSNEKARHQFITTVVNRASELGVDGLNLDFEGMKGSDRTAFTQFVKEFTAAAHAKHLIVSIDLPRGSVSWNHLTAIDHAEIGKTVDYVMIMAYDQYYSGSTEPGSVSGLSWAAQGVEEFLSYGIPRDKLVLGIPFYVRQWKLDSQGKLVGNQAIYTRGLEELLASVEYKKEWDSRFEQYRIEYKKDGFTYVFWLEDEATVKARIDIAKKYNLAGVAAWRLGQEPDAFWKAMAAEKN